MENALSKVLVRTILGHAQDYSWTMQEIGLLALRLDDHREYRLHVWDPEYSDDDPPVHDHPFDFTSKVIVGEMTNTLYEKNDRGVEFIRIRYSPADEEDRRTDTVRLSAVRSTYAEGNEYSQLAHELHDSRQVPGTVTVIRMAFKDVSGLTVCRREDSAWTSGRSRPATGHEVKRITNTALELF